jgi:hypothetical protein
MNRKRRSVQRKPDKHYTQRWPSPSAMQNIRRRIHELTNVRGNRAKDVTEVIAALNPVLRGWGNYFRAANANRELNKVEHHVRDRLTRWMWRRCGQRAWQYPDLWPHERLHRMGLHRPAGTVASSAHVACAQPSVSRVWENRKHGLKREIWNRAELARANFYQRSPKARLSFLQSGALLVWLKPFL